jgi:fatty-acyl-CoA synthase
MGISCWVAHKAVWTPEKVALRFHGRDITYREFEERVAHLTGFMVERLGVGEGDRVAFLGGNSPEILDLIFACARLGAIFVPLNARMTVPQLRLMLENADPRCIFAGPDHQAAAEECWHGRAPDMLVQLGGSDSEGLTVDDLIGTATPVLCNPNRDQMVPVLIAYTSGTTGTPKGAVHTQDSVTFSAVNSNQVWNMRSRDNVLTFLPMFHVGGLLIFTLPAIHVGATVTIQRTFEPGAVLDEIGAGVTLILAPPTHSRAIFAHPKFASTDFSSIRCAGIGSTFVPPEVFDNWAARSVPTQQNYGLTEGVPILATPFEHAVRKSRSAGTSVLYTQARVFDDNLNRMPPGQPGEIGLRGRSLFSGYWRNAEATAAAFRDGWFMTGDVAYTDEDHYFHIVDRKKNIVIVGSSNVYPADLETILDECSSIAEGAVVGIPDPETGEALVACIRLGAGATMDAAAVLALFEGRLARYQHPKHVLFVDEFPRTALGKIQKVELARAVRARLNVDATD